MTLAAESTPKTPLSLTRHKIAVPHCTEPYQ